MRTRSKRYASWWASLALLALVTGCYLFLIRYSSEVVSSEAAVIYDRTYQPFLIDTIHVHPLDRSMMPIIEAPEARSTFGTLARLSALDKPECCVLRPSLCRWYLDIVDHLCTLEVQSRLIQQDILRILPPEQTRLEPIDKTLVDCSGIVGAKQLSLVRYYLVNMAEHRAPKHTEPKRKSKIPGEEIHSNDFEGVLNLLVVATRSTSKPLSPQVLAALIPKVENLRDTHRAMAFLSTQVVESLDPYRRTFLPPNALEQACSRDARAMLLRLRGQVVAKTLGPQQDRLPRFVE